MSDQSYDVIIIGYGPTGLILAASLGQKGHRVALVERWPQLYGLPRLSHIDDETARIIQANADVDLALRDAVPIDSYRFVNAAGDLLTSVGEPKTGPCGYPAEISIYQPDIEDAIDQRVRQCPSVEHFLGWEATAFSQNEDYVSATIVQVASGESQTLRAQFLVGCDGARSRVRETMGVASHDFDFSERWLNIDVEKRRALPARFNESIQYCDPARGHMHLSIGRSRVRFELAVKPGENEADFTTPDFAWNWLSEQHGLGPEDIKILRQVVYTFSARLAKQWRDRRILLAGDACHTMPPYLGQGACSGMRDGFNLGWRLDLVLRELSPETLLDSYQQERAPHVETITRIAIGLGRLANEHDPERARLRDEHLRLHPPAKLDFPILRHGLLDPAQSKLTGTVAMQARVRRHGVEGRFDDVIGRGFVLLTREPLEAEDAAAAFAAMGGLVVSLADFDDVEGRYAAFFETHAIAAILARPDFVTFGTAQTPADVSALLCALLSGLGDRTAQQLEQVKP